MPSSVVHKNVYLIPSGITPITFNDRFSEEINKRKRVELGIRSNESTEQDYFIRSNYLDLTQLQDYWVLSD